MEKKVSLDQIVNLEGSFFTISPVEGGYIFNGRSQISWTDLISSSELLEVNQLEEQVDYCLFKLPLDFKSLKNSARLPS
ncbi:MAG: hypothetical protein NVS2B14_00080 [Chamaesiphon sp.]